MPSASPTASGKNTAREREPWNRRRCHDRARDGADGDAEKKCSPQSDRIGERTGEQGEDRHGRRPNPADHRARALIAEAEIFRQPQDHRFVRDRVGGVDEKLDQERQPEFALRSAQDGELADESGEARVQDRTDAFFRRHDGFGGEVFFHARMQLHHFRDKLAAIEQREIVKLFARADKARRDSEFILDRDDDSAFAAAVEFGHDQTG